jgi:multiple antibiotic resistance protein
VFTGSFALDAALFAQAFVALFVVIDPLGTVPVFLALTRDQTAAHRRRTARLSVLVAAGIVAVFALAGTQLLQLMNISLQALQLAGGLLLALIALDLLRAHCDQTPADARSGEVAFVPLGTPLLAGPGAIAATVLYVEQAPGPGEVLSVWLALVTVLVVTWLTLRFSGVVVRLVKENGLDLLTRIVGLLAAAVAVQFMASAIQFWVQWGVTV